MHDDYFASLSDWIAILSISTRLLFQKVRERAIKEITKLLDQVEAFELIGLAIKFDVEQWLKPAYRRIVTRSNLITHAEAAKVPFAMAVMLDAFPRAILEECAKSSSQLPGSNLNIPESNHRLGNQTHGVRTYRDPQRCGANLWFARWPVTWLAGRSKSWVC
jgi:hypothetical protein